MTHCNIIKKRGFFGPQKKFWITAHEGLTEVQRYNTFWFGVYYFMREKNYYRILVFHVCQSNFFEFIKQVPHIFQLLYSTIISSQKVPFQTYYSNIFMNLNTTMWPMMRILQNHSPVRVFVHSSSAILQSCGVDVCFYRNSYF